MLDFFTKEQTGFGLDLSSSSLKLFQFEKKSGQLTVKGYHETALPKSMMLNDVISDQATFEHMLKAALDKPHMGHITGKYMVANLPESKSFVRVIQMPLMTESDAEAAVPFEAENFIPMPIDQVYLDWQKLSEVGDKMNILIIATPKDFVDGYVKTLEKAGLKPLAFEVESQSCHRALVKASQKETLLIVDMSEDRTSLVMVEDGNLQFTSSIPIAGSSFTESIARTLGISSAKAEAIKLKIGVSNTPEYPNIKTALLPVLNNLSAEIKNILKFHSEHSDKQVSKILLTGGTARLVNLTQFLTSEFTDLPGVVVELGNPWLNAPKAQPTAMDLPASLSYTTAIGLGLRGIGII